MRDFRCTTPIGSSAPGSRASTSEKAFATYLRDHLAGKQTRRSVDRVSGCIPRRPGGAIQIGPGSQRCIPGGPEAPSSRSLVRRFAKTAASSRESWPSSGTPRGQPNDWRVGRPGVPFARGWRRARRSVVVPDARGARHRRAGQAMPGEPHRRLSLPRGHVDSSGRRDTRLRSPESGSRGTT